MRRLFPVLGFVLLIALPSTALANQRCDFKEGNHFAVGYAGNIPNEWLGLCLFSTKSEGVGFYFDLKVSVPMIYGGDDFYDNISIHQAEGWGDNLTDTEDGWISANLGLTAVLSSSLAFYAGVGYTANTDYRNYYDEFHILGTNGSYWVEGDTEESVNVLGGLLVVLGDNWGLQVGGETSPGGVTAGVFFSN